VALQRATLSPDLAKAVLSRIHQPAMLLSLDRVILETNDLFDERFGDGTVSRGHPCHELTHGLSLPCKVWGESCPLDRPGETQLHHHTAARRAEYDEVVARPVRDFRGRVVAFLVVSRPVGLA